MTLNDIIVSALSQLDRGHDGQTVDTWRDKLTRYANEAVVDLAGVLECTRTDTVDIEQGRLDITKLEKCCVKVNHVSRGFRRMPFFTGESTAHIRVLGGDGPAQVNYRYLPRDMTSTTDVPDLPAYCHGLIVTYVVARERASADASTQRGANMYFDLYQMGKRQLRSTLGEEDTYKIINRW